MLKYNNKIFLFIFFINFLLESEYSLSSNTTLNVPSKPTKKQMDTCKTKERNRLLEEIPKELFINDEDSEETIVENCKKILISNARKVYSNTQGQSRALESSASSQNSEGYVSRDRLLGGRVDPSKVIDTVQLDRANSQNANVVIQQGQSGVGVIAPFAQSQNPRAGVSTTLQASGQRDSGSVGAVAAQDFPDS